jgi:3-phenylpropionate/trans-cinnamate dioxygenase ferredoxin component
VGEFVELLGVNDLKDGDLRGLTVRGRALLVAKVAGRLYAADDRCPHMGASLSKGKLDGTVVICPRHHSRFDLSDGRFVQWTDWVGWLARLAKVVRSPRAIVTHRVKVEGGRVWVEI